MAARFNHLLPIGALAALVTLVLDQASKWWLLNVLDIAERAPVRVTPFFDLVLQWNIGISFGLLQNDSPAAQLALMLVKVVAVIALAIWMARSQTILATIALGLIIGGAIGNVIDRLRFGAVVDFLYFHAGSWYWPAFNLADSAICLGVAAMLLDGLLLRRDAPQANRGEDVSP